MMDAGRIYNEKELPQLGMLPIVKDDKVFKLYTFLYELRWNPIVRIIEFDKYFRFEVWDCKVLLSSDSNFLILSVKLTTQTDNPEIYVIDLEILKYCVVTGDEVVAFEFPYLTHNSPNFDKKPFCYSLNYQVWLDLPSQMVKQTYYYK
ncbi:hypothetical protein [Acinetobacter populi]|nr:hypothetical protein [Acinetobacter populi]